MPTLLVGFLVVELQGTLDGLADLVVVREQDAHAILPFHEPHLPCQLQRQLGLGSEELVHLLVKGGSASSSTSSASSSTLAPIGLAIDAVALGIGSASLVGSSSSFACSSCTAPGHCSRRSTGGR